MEQGTKKIIMVVVVVLCLAAAGLITLSSREKEEGVNTIKAGESSIWLKCRNPNCENTWQMDKREYFDYLENQKRAMGMTVPAVPCPKCHEDSGYRAEKCPKCGFIFERNSVPNDFPDRCPECGFSHSEDIRVKARNQ